MKGEYFMESKVVLFNSNGIKIGETYARRARQLVSRQRAEWLGENQQAIRFYPEMENMDGTVTEPEPIEVQDTQAHQLYFAHWSRGYYYLAVIDEDLENYVRVTFFDGYKRILPKEQVIELQEAFNTMTFQGNWQEGLFWYNGVLSSLQPLIMAYNDGDVEHVSLSQLRAFFPR